MERCADPRPWRCRDRTIPWGPQTLVMGILNCTPDSFSDGGQWRREDDLRRRIDEIAEEGADILDIGGESTRPGAEPVSFEEERARVEPALQQAAERFPGPISIDTAKAAIARHALSLGAHIVNDVTAGRGDPEMMETVREFGAGAILMHMRGEPRTMQDDPCYGEVVDEIRQFLAARCRAWESAGVGSAHLAVDPGIGFGKRLPHNLDILRASGRFGFERYPVVIGLSRKRFLGEITGRGVEERVAAGLSATALAVWHGAAVIRTHDVKKTCDAVRVADRMRRAK